MTTFFSRFPDTLTPETKPISLPEIYTLHQVPHDLVTTVRRTFGPGGWQEHSHLYAESVELAREMVPPEGVWIPGCPPSYALEAYKIRR